MKRWCVLLFIFIACGAHAVRVTDDRGVSVDLEKPPQRIVTLLPSLTETVCELGGCDRLVGVDSFSNWPEPVRALPHLGGLEDASVERIVALAPDIVFMSAGAPAVGRLEALGVKVFAMEPRTVADVHRVFIAVGRLLSREREAQAANERIEQGIAQAARGLPASQRGKSVYFEVDSGPYAASESSHIGELLTRLGAVNIVPARLGSVPKLNPEYVVRADPQVIIVPGREAAGLMLRPGWSRIRAVREGRVCALASQDADVVVRPGPRLAEAARILARCLAMSGNEHARAQHP
jgi:iron complex transport system substrate-binding protein